MTTTQQGELLTADKTSKQTKTVALPICSEAVERAVSCTKQPCKLPEEVVYTTTSSSCMNSHAKPLNRHGSAAVRARDHALQLAQLVLCRKVAGS